MPSLKIETDIVVMQLERTTEALEERVQIIEQEDDDPCDCMCHEHDTDELRRDLAELTDIVTKLTEQVADLQAGKGLEDIEQSLENVYTRLDVLESA